ncbi:DUF4190 domain-containing protein [Arthrobacter sp. H-02-3]|uniref:DUF4190 domain-containing protein n=1 Tax=Arthrobacter sp. H-02-3 TaxID=2703675 RepID=UPI000DD1C9DD|nr:DUF4190 domain-containing protein [Arthrobacter sp. H-02-3]PVZ60202.1 hypothetical protein C9424_02765 [Arthrobacter sp. H-02-3]
MTEQPQQGKDESKAGPGKDGMPEGYQPTLRLPDHQPDVPPQAPPVGQEPGQATGQEAGQPATHQFAQPEPPQQPDYPQEPSAGRQPGQEHYGQPAQDQGQFSSPYPPIYGQSGTTPYAPGQGAYGQPAQQYGQQSPYAQPGSANAYGQPAYYSVPAAPKGLSIASMCCGIAALVGFGFFLLPQLAAVILGHLALRREPAGRGMAIAGLVMGYVAIAVTVLVMVIFGLVIGSARSRGYGV